MQPKHFAAMLVLASVASTAMAQGRWDWSGGRPGEAEIRLIGPGVPVLYPQLRESPRGRAFVMRNFDFNRDGVISPAEARAANQAFAGVAGARRNRFDWDARDSGFHRHHGWDRRRMHDYGFHQTPRGATMTMQESVLFSTDSATLRPRAIDKLGPLADYLIDNPGVRVAIDGYTDSRGSDAHNQALSERRAASVRSALVSLGVTRGRFVIAGHGERQPVAPNDTPEGMQLNRRVDVTLLGQRAEFFNRMN